MRRLCLSTAKLMLAWRWDSVTCVHSTAQTTIFSVSLIITAFRFFLLSVFRLFIMTWDNNYYAIICAFTTALLRSAAKNGHFQRVNSISRAQNTQNFCDPVRTGFCVLLSHGKSWTMPEHQWNMEISAKLLHARRIEQDWWGTSVPVYAVE